MSSAHRRARLQVRHAVQLLHAACLQVRHSLALVGGSALRLAALAQGTAAGCGGAAAVLIVQVDSEMYQTYQTPDLPDLPDPPDPPDHKFSAIGYWIMPEDRWPALSYDDWKDTYATLHLWSQVVGKVALALAPPINHSWAIALQLTARGLATRPLPYTDRTFTIEFDFIDHVLVVRTSDGEQRTLALAPQSVRDFYRELMRTLQEMSLAVKIWPVAVELPAPIRLDTDTEHHSYDPVFANRLWRILLQVERVFSESRCAFVGKCSPVNFFWGSFDLAVTRFSGRPAPPREGPAFMRDAYSHEVISHGFWPGSGPVLEPAFYCYAVPEPAGFKGAHVQPDAAFYHGEMGEFILPYEAVRRDPSPDRALHAFIDSTYQRAATLAHWDREVVER